MRGWTIISGGQTGVDRAALDAAEALGMPYRGFVPKGRRAENGPIAAKYRNLVETEQDGYLARTRRNLEQADATLVIFRGEPEGGTLETIRRARRAGKPLLLVDLAELDSTAAMKEIGTWLDDLPIGALNIAGPRASKDPAIYAEARALLERVLAERSNNASRS